jgi:hypothetical protein
MADNDDQMAKRGSQMWMQRLVNQSSAALNNAIGAAIQSTDPNSIRWVSPLATDGYVEYRDEVALQRLGIELKDRPLKSFWPRRGPVWDGLGRTGDGQILLVEAKAHIGEAVSPPSRATPQSKALIDKSLRELKDYIGGNPDADWSGTFYQVTNRLAHLYLLRTLNNIPAHLIFLYFVGDEDMDGPMSVDEWKGAISLLEAYLGVRRHKLSQYVHHVYYDVRDIQNEG